MLSRGHHKNQIESKNHVCPPESYLEGQKTPPTRDKGFPGAECRKSELSPDPAEDMWKMLSFHHWSCARLCSSHPHDGKMKKDTKWKRPRRQLEMDASHLFLTRGKPVSQHYEGLALVTCSRRILAATISLPGPYTNQPDSLGRQESCPAHLQLCPDVLGKATKADVRFHCL